MAIHNTRVGMEVLHQFIYPNIMINVFRTAVFRSLKFGETKSGDDTKKDELVEAGDDAVTTEPGDIQETSVAPDITTEQAESVSEGVTESVTETVTKGVPEEKNDNQEIKKEVEKENLSVLFPSRRRRDTEPEPTRKRVSILLFTSVMFI